MYEHIPVAMPPACHPDVKQPQLTSVQLVRLHVVADHSAGSENYAHIIKMCVGIQSSKKNVSWKIAWKIS